MMGWTSSAGGGQSDVYKMHHSTQNTTNNTEAGEDSPTNNISTESLVRRITIRFFMIFHVFLLPKLIISSSLLVIVKNKAICLTVTDFGVHLKWVYLI